MCSRQTIWGNHEHTVTECADKHLTTDNDEPNGDEDPVSEDTLEDPQLIIDLSGTDHVKDLHKHESGEDEGQVTGWTQFGSHITGVELTAIPIGSTAWEDEAWVDTLVFVLLNVLWNHPLTGEEEGEQNNALPERLTKNMLDHSA